MAKYKEATRSDEQKFQEVRTAAKSTVRWGRINFRIGWMLPYTLEKITGLVLAGEESKMPAKTAALLLLNGFFSINLFYPLLWRWLYYYVPSNVLVKIVAEGKKKEALAIQDFWTCIILATAMRDSKQNLKKEEADRILQELHSERLGQSEKSIQT